MRMKTGSVNHPYRLCWTIFAKLSQFVGDYTNVSDSLESKLTRLEMLYAEQDYTIQTLNDVVAQQDQEISMLTLNIEKIKDQLQMLKSELSGNIDTVAEKPPHY